MYLKTKQAPGQRRWLAGESYYGCGEVWMRLVSSPGEVMAAVQKMEKRRKVVSSKIPCCNPEQFPVQMF